VSPCLFTQRRMRGARYDIGEKFFSSQADRRMGGAQRYPSAPVCLSTGIAALHPSYGSKLGPEKEGLALVQPTNIAIRCWP